MKMYCKNCGQEIVLKKTTNSDYYHVGSVGLCYGFDHITCNPMKYWMETNVAELDVERLREDKINELMNLQL